MQHLGNKWGPVQPTQRFAKGKINSFYPDVCLNKVFDKVPPMHSSLGLTYS